MSTVNVNRMVDSQGGVLAPISSIHRNRIINGSMTVDQRNAGASVTPTNGAYSLDRWIHSQTTASKYSVQQNAGSITPPVGFTNYLGVTSLSAYSSGAGDAFLTSQYIEGFNVADLGWGTANAATITISFWIRSSLTGTFSFSLANAFANRNYIATYTVSSANTWEQKSVTIVGDTTGTWGKGNGNGLQLRFDLGSGSNFNGTAGSWGSSNLLRTSGSQSVVGTNGATFYLTGVQLEKGTQATSFEYRQYGTELALCQRYYYKLGGTGSGTKIGFASYEDSTAVRGVIPFPVTMRAIPTGSASGNTRFYTTAPRTYTTSVDSDSVQMGGWLGTTTTSGTAGQAGFVDTNGFTASFIQFSAEL